MRNFVIKRFLSQSAPRLFNEPLGTALAQSTPIGVETTNTVFDTFIFGMRFKLGKWVFL